MKSTRLHLAALSVGLAIVGTMALPNTADAQRGQGGGGQGRGQGRGQGGGGFGGGMMRGGGGMFGADPTRSSASQLIYREDVQGELGLAPAQREKLQTAQQTSRTSMRDRMTNSGIDFQAMRDPNLDPAKRQEMMKQMQDKMQEVQKTMVADQQKQVDEVLTPAQRTRLAELDLQYRGPLSLADEEVAKRFKVTPDQQREISNILTEYRTGQQEAMRAMRPGGGQPGQPGGAGGNGGQPGQPGGFDPEAMRTRMEEARKATDRVKKASEDKVVALLTAPQKSAWASAKGKAFTFKTDIQMGGRGGGQGRGQRGGAAGNGNGIP